MATLLELAARLQSAHAVEEILLIAVKATLVLIIARLMLAALPRASAATKHLIATAALIAVGLMPVLTFVVPTWNVVVKSTKAPLSTTTSATSSATPSPTRSAKTAAVRSQYEPAVSDREPAKTVGVTDAEEQESIRPISAALSIARATGVVPAEPLTAMERAANVVRSTWLGMIALSVAILAALMLLQMAVGMLGVWHVARNAEELTQETALRELDAACDRLALRSNVRLLRSSRISVPVIWGVLHPILLLPADVVTWPSERLRVVLLHELAHLKRFDGVSLILTRIAVSLFWFHPLAWSLERAGRSECERACDDLVLKSGTKASEYADHLLAIARSMPTFDPFRAVTLAMSRKSQLEGRLLSILQPHVARRVFSGRSVAIACALAVAVVVPVSALRLSAAPTPQKESPAVKTTQKTQQKSEQRQQKTTEQTTTTQSDSSITVTSDLEAIQDYLLTKLGKYDKRADRWARQPRTGEDWYDRAYDYYHNDRYEEAASAFLHSADEEYRRATSLYNAACSYALLGDAGRAIPTLQQAIREGWDDIDKIAEDSDFDPIRSNPQFARAISTSNEERLTRRVDDTLDRYQQLRAGGTAVGVGDRVQKDEVSRKIDREVRDSVKAAVRNAVQGVVEGVRNGDFDFNFDSDTDDVDQSDWFDVGLDLLRLRKLDESIDAFQHSIAANERVGTSMYNIACAYSLKGDARRGMEWLDKSIENGFSSDDKLANDPDITLLRTQSGFQALRQKAEDLQMQGCCDHSWKGVLGGDAWRDTVEHHRRMTALYPNSGRAWFNLGYTSLQARDNRQGIDAFRRALALDYRTGTTSYNIACGYALDGDRNSAFDWLAKARTAGFDLRNYLRHDDDLDNLHRDPRWDALVDELHAARRARRKR